MMTRNIWEMLSAESPVRQYVQWIQESGNHALFETKYQSLVLSRPQRECFLSVIIRTQGKRPEMLQDVFLSLQAQTDQDFEVILICHRAEREAIPSMEALVNRQPDAFRQKVRMQASEEGERGAPVNLGFALACGRYAVALDDDDLVFDHWVAAFHEAERQHPGMILHAWVLTQPWKKLTDAKGNCRGLTAAGRPEGTYCQPYRTLAEQYENRCPFMGMAFPLYLFRELHIMLNEELTTTEDWDFILRTAGISGVHDIQEPTAIYRQWQTGETSHQAASFEEWEENYKKSVRDQMRNPILLSQEEARECRKDLVGMQFSETKGRSCFMKDAVLFWSAGDEPFSEDRHMRASLSLKEDRMRVVFDLAGRRGLQEASLIRFDPADETLFCLEDLTLTVYDQDRKAYVLKIENARETNGIVDGNNVLFLGDDPRVIYPLPQTTRLSSVEVTARVSYQCPPILERWAAELGADSRWLSENRNKAKLYLDGGDGFSEARMLEQKGVYQGQDYRVVFNLPEGMGDGLKRIRVDPTEAGMVWLDQMKILLKYADGEVARVSPPDYNDLNGFLTTEGFACIPRDPYLVIPAEGKGLRQVSVTGQIAFVDAAKMEMLTAEAVRVPSYQQLFEQLAEAQKQESMW